ncbi:MAG: hypothetical protein GXY18_09025, partial [Methanomicrobiales archaeon]|nr:hypothetical protein [Methanomicrobiales archaeon]
MMKTIYTILSIFCLAALFVCCASADDKPEPPKDCTDYAKAAATLGITEDALKSAIHPGPDFASAAKTLGVTEDALKAAMSSGEKGMDFASAAKTLGVTEDALKSAMGMKE